MKKVTIVIPNYNGEKYIDECFSALTKQSYKDFDVILADNGSEDNSISKACQYKDKLDLKIKKLNCNYGFAKAVNEGIRQSQAEYVILLNNDTHAGRHFVENLLKAIEMEKDVFAAQALMLQYNSPELVDSAGDYFCGLGVAFSAGKDKKHHYIRKRKIFFQHAQGLPYTDVKSLRKSDILKKNFLLTWKMWIYAIGQNFLATVIFLCRMQKCCMWEVLPAGQDIMNSR